MSAARPTATRRGVHEAAGLVHAPHRGAGGPAGSAGPPALQVSIENEVAEPTISQFWDLYTAAFSVLSTRAVARQVLRRDEFVEEMADPRISKYLVADGSGVVGMTTLTSSLDAIPWISADYFAHHYPEHSTRGAVYYLGFSLVRPSHQRSHIFALMIGTIARRMATERAILAYDICAYNHTTMRLARAGELLLRRNADCDVNMLDSQTYYAAEFSGEGPGGGPLGCGPLSDAPLSDTPVAAPQP